MNLTVTIYAANPRGDVVKHGEIRWDGKALSAEYADDVNNMTMLNNIMAENFYRPGEAEIDPKKNPEEWLRNLWRMYRSPYLQASKAAIE